MQNRYPNVFKPLKLRGSTILKNRLEFTPFVSAQIDSEGCPSEGTVNFVRMQARTGAANIVMGSIVDPDRKMNWYADLDFCHDKFVPALSLLADEAHKYGAMISYEVCHSGRGFLPSMRNEGDTGGITDEDPVPDAMATTGNLMTREDMDWMKDRFVKSCLRAKKAGFDIIFLHVGHNNLLGTFLSPSTNSRTDEYGGSRENRMRYPLEMVAAVREAIGPDMPIEMRVSAEEMLPGGSTLEDALEFLKLCEPHIDIAHFSNGNVFHRDSRIYTSPMYTMEHKQNVRYA